MARATGSFTVQSWDESTYRELDDGAKLTKASVAFALEGDLAAEATWDAVMCYRSDGTAAYTGMQRVVGNLAGATGSFVVQSEGEFAAGEARSRWQVIDGSGTGDLAGLTGTGEAVASASPPGTFTFDYQLG
jgi:hypothetical protein